MPDQDTRYRGVDVGAGEWVIYDTKNENAWIQSDYFLEVNHTRE